MKNLIIAALIAISAAAHADPIDVANAKIAAEQQAMDDEIAAVHLQVQDFLANLPATNDVAWQTECLKCDIEDSIWPTAPVFEHTDFGATTEVKNVNDFSFDIAK